MVMRATKLAVLIDLQNAIVGMSTAPHPAAQVVANSAKLAEAFRGHGAPVVYVRVDLNDFLELPVDQPINLGPALFRRLALLPDFSPATSCLRNVTGGAFAGTDLEQQLKSRGVDTVVLTGISTNAGVESTARQGTGLGFGFVVVEDACSGQDRELHRFAFEKMSPRLCRVRSTNEVLAALAAEQTPHKGRDCGSTFTKKTQSDIQRERVQRNRIPRRKDKSRGEYLAEN
jgi:nicotinamidase-related amidase